MYSYNSLVMVGEKTFSDCLAFSRRSSFVRLGLIYFYVCYNCSQWIAALKSKVFDPINTV